MRLTYTTDEDLSLSVTFDRWDADRAQWIWSIDCAGENIARGDDLRSGAGDFSAVSALRSLGSFLGAWIESVRYVMPDGTVGGDNADLFPRAMADLGIVWENVAFELTEALGEE